MAFELQGTSFIGYATRGSASGASFNAVDPSSGEPLEPAYRCATANETSAAAEKAAAAFLEYRKADARTRSGFLRAIAGRIEGSVEAIAERGVRETALPDARLRAETARTVGQLRLFATLVEEGSWVDARIDRAQPERQPQPKPDVRSQLVPLGPVAVFGSSNFPLAFSVAGGDTASALAAGNPVIVKAHPAHPGLSEIVGQAIAEAAREMDLPEGVFSLLFDEGIELGQSLVSHPLVKAVGFTGSRSGGQALMALAASREQPIPVFAEMSSVNPLFALPQALAEDANAIAEGYVGSLALGAGQFCTNPGVLVVPQGAESDAFIAAVATRLEKLQGASMLGQSVHRRYMDAVSKRGSQAEVKTLFAPTPEAVEAAAAKAQALPYLFEVEARRFLEDPSLWQEIFGPSALVVRARSALEACDVALFLEGQLTASIFATEDELAGAADLVSALQDKAGRLLYNQFPTGVEVCPAMVHGGPYPATSDGRSTSVGTAAIERFVRRFCYQNWPQGALPPALQDGNSLGIWRQIDGVRSQA